jgi:hypothetical protein
MPFNKSIIIHVPIRLEAYRFSKKEFQNFKNNLKELSKDPRNIIAANNYYDVQYRKYLTGLNVLYIPNYCGYANENYNPIYNEFLIGPSRLTVKDDFFDDLNEEIANSDNEIIQKFKFVKIRKLYKKYNFKDLSNHKALLFIPYTVNFN